jgi:hypothetical protein
MTQMRRERHLRCDVLCSRCDEPLVILSEIPAFRATVAFGDGCAHQFQGSAPGREPGRSPIFLVQCIAYRRPGEVRLVKNHLPAEGARGLREQVENRMPIHRGTKEPARQRAGWRFGCSRKRTAMSASSLSITSSQAPAMISIVERLDFLHPALRGDIQRLERAPRLNATSETSVPGLRFIGPVSAKSFSPLFRFVAGSEYASWIVSAQLASQVSS